MAKRKILSGIAKILDTTTILTAQPLESIKNIVKGGTAFKEQKEEFYSKPLGKQITNIAVSGALGAATILTAGTAGATIKAAVTGAKASTKLLIGAGLLTGGAALAGAVAANPKQAVVSTIDILQTPKDIFTTSKEAVETFPEEVTFENVLSYMKENPEVSISAALLALGVTGGAATKLLSAYNTWNLSNAIDNLPKQNETITPTAPPTPSVDKVITPTAPPTAPPTTQPNTAVTSPVLPQTQTITATTGTGTTKRKKRRSNPLQQHFRQSVNIDIINNNSSNRITKKYINAIALRN